MTPGDAATIDDGKPNGARARKAARTRAGLLDAAKLVFEEKGFLSSTVADIVQRAGVSHGTFYHYFESREDVLREVAEQADQRLNAPMDHVILDRSSHAAPAQRIREGVRVFLRAYQEEARIIAVVEEVSHYNDHVRASRNETWRRYVDKFAASIGELQRRGLADPTLEPALASAVLASITSRFPEMWLAREVVDCSLDEAAEQMARIFINALGIKDRSG